MNGNSDLRPRTRCSRTLLARLISPLGALVLVTVVYLVTLALLPLHGIWINDNGNRLIQLQGIIASNYRDYSITWPGRSIDPTFDHAPISYPFAVVRNDRLFSLYSPVFPTVSSPFFRLLGWPGLYLLPLVSSVAMLAGLLRLMDTLEVGRRARIYAILIAGLATPIWFYSLTFWEHTIAVCLAVWGMAFIMAYLKDCCPGGGSRRNLVTGAVLSALAIYLRDDMYSMTAALLIVLFVYSPGRRLKTAALFMASTIGALVPLWLFQWKAIGAPFGLHLQTLLFTTAGITSHLLDRPQVFYNLYVGSSATVWHSLLLTAPFWILFCLNPKMSNRSGSLAIPLYGVAAIVTSLVIYKCFVHAPKPIACVGYTSSLFPASPVLIFAFLRFADSSVTPSAGVRLRSILWQVCLVYAVVYGLASPKAASWGIHWGNRLVLVLYPLLAVLCAASLADWERLTPNNALRANLAAPGSGFKGKKWQAAVVALVILLSVAAQVYSISILERKMDFSDRLNQAIAEAPEEAIVTDQWWLGQELYAQFGHKMIFRIQSQQDLDLLTALLASHGYTRLLYVSPPMPGERVGPEVREISDRGLNYWNLRFFPVDLRPN